MRGLKWGVWAVAVLMLWGTLATAQETKFFQLSLVPDVQIVPPGDSVSGVRLALWGENQNVSGLDVGVIGQTRGNFEGFFLGIISMVEGDSAAVAWHPFGYGRVDGDFTGWHAATFFSYLKGSSTGLQNSLVSRTRDQFTGLQLGLIYAETGGHIGGVQAGLVNRAASVKGLQLGLVNLADDMYGIQVGLVNYIKTGYLPVFVIANAKF